MDKTRWPPGLCPHFSENQAQQQEQLPNPLSLIRPRARPSTLARPHSPGLAMTQIHGTVPLYISVLTSLCTELACPCCAGSRPSFLSPAHTDKDAGASLGDNASVPRAGTARCRPTAPARRFPVGLQAVTEGQVLGADLTQADGCVCPRLWVAPPGGHTCPRTPGCHQGWEPALTHFEVGGLQRGAGEQPGEDHVYGDGEAPADIPVSDLNVLNLGGIAGIALCAPWRRERASLGQKPANVQQAIEGAV